MGSSRKRKSILKATPRATRSAKTRKAVAHVEKSVPTFDAIVYDVLDSYGLLSLGFETLLANPEWEKEDRRNAIIGLDHGVRLLKKASGQLDEANIRLHAYCSQHNLVQEALEEGAS
jgi:hypothetical protein